MLDTASNGNFLLNTIEDGSALIVNMANSDAIYGADTDRSIRRPIDADSSRNRDIKALNEKLDKLILGQQKSYEVSMVSDDQPSQVEEACYAQNNFKGPNQPYIPFNKNPLFSYRNNNVSNPQDQTYPNTNTQYQQKTYIPRPPYNNNRPPYQPQPQQNQNAATNQDVMTMLTQMMKEQSSQTAELQAIRAEFNKRLDATQAEFRDRFEQLNSRVQFLEGHQAGTSTVTTSGQLPGKSIQNPKEYTVHSISIGSKNNLPTSVVSCRIAEDSKFEEGEAGLKQDKNETVEEAELVLERIEEKVYGCNVAMRVYPTIEKLDDPGEITLTCLVDNIAYEKCLVDTGAAINTISLEAAEELGYFEYEPCDYKIRLADKSLTKPVGILDDVRVHVKGIDVIADFAVLKTVNDRYGQLLLGRPFLAAAKAVIDVANRHIDFNTKRRDRSPHRLDNPVRRDYPMGYARDAPNLRFFLEPSEPHEGEVEYTVKGGRLPMPHEWFPSSTKETFGPFCVGNKTHLGSISMMGTRGTKVPFNGQKVKIQLTSVERTPRPHLFHDD